MQSPFAVLWLALLGPFLCAPQESRLVPRVVDSAPEILPLPARPDSPDLDTTERLRSLGLHGLPHFERVRAGLCRGDATMRAAWLDGLGRTLSLPERPLALAYSEVANACGAPQCDWVREQIERHADPVRSALWWNLAQCTPLGEEARFERWDAPAEAVVAFHSRRGRTEATHSPRLAEVVESALAAPGDEWRAALRAYEWMDHRLTAAHLLALADAASEPDRERAIVYAMRGQSDPKAAERFAARCQADRAGSAGRVRRDWHPVSRVPSSPCGSATAADWQDAEIRREPTRQTDDPVRDYPGELGRAARLRPGPGWQFDDGSAPLWRIAELVRPDLDAVVFEDRWPAVDAVSLRAGPARIGVFVNGDAVELRVPLRGDEPDREFSELRRAELEAALGQERRIDAWLGDERFGVRYQPDRSRYDQAAILELANELLAAAKSELRIARLKTDGDTFPIVVATPEQLSNAAERGLLAP